MTETMTTPVRATTEALEYLNELGLRAEYERLLEEIDRRVPNIRDIEFSLQPDYEYGGDPMLGLGVTYQSDTDIYFEMVDWRVEHLSPRFNVCVANNYYRLRASE